MINDDWIHVRSNIKLEDAAETHEGFVYLIENKTKNKSYIGKKNFKSKTTKKLTQKELSELTDKRKSKSKLIIKDSNWRTYNSSNKELLEDIKNGDEIEKYIIHLCKTKAELTYFETKEQFTWGVIESDKYYNDNILGKFYKNIFK